MEQMKLEDINIAIHHGVATILIDREVKLNALNSSVLEQLFRGFSQIEKDQSVRVIVLKGAGNKAFAAGADLEEISEKVSIFELRDYYLKFNALYDKMRSVPQPIIAAVNGYAFGGGCLLALSCDMVIATKKSKFGQQEVNYGFMGGASILPKLVGKQIASEIVMLGATFDSETFYHFGLVNKVIEEQELDKEVANICTTIVKKPAQALNMIKKTINYSMETGLTESNKYETEVAAICLSTKESQEAIVKFLNRTNK